MKYCVRCLYPANHPLNISFDDDGVCSGCRIHEEKDSLNWNFREKKLKRILFSYKNSSKENYDCIIPVSGARDSYFIVDTIKRLYGLNPLLVTYNKQYNTPLGIRNLAYLKTIFDCDLLTLTVNPEIVKKVTRITLQEMGSIYWHCIAGQTVFPVQIAVRFKIPLIIWGVHQGCDQVGMFSHLNEVEMTGKYRKEHDLMGYDAEDLIAKYNDLKFEDVRPFIYPNDKEIEKVGVRGIYLSNYIRWDSKKQHEDMIKIYDYRTTEQTRTFDTYNDVDCFNYSDVHDYIKYLKWGFGKVSDHATREIRLKRLTREEGIEKVKLYQKKKPKYLKLFLNWIGITESGFYFLIDRFRDQRVWERDKTHQWRLKDSILNHINDNGVLKTRLEKYADCIFQVTKRLGPKLKGDGYILIGKGIGQT